MSELVRDDVSTESICTVIENCTASEKPTLSISDPSESPKTNETNDSFHENCNDRQKKPNIIVTTDDEIVPSSSFNDSIDSENCDSSLKKLGSVKPRTKLKKSVSFDPNDEKIRKFIAGDPIVDQQNPFKSNSLSKKKKTPPPVPTRRSTLSVRKTVTQQLREREREKEKERERVKNEANNRKAHLNGTTPTSPDEFITTEEVLKQSKYVKTYIKNPDPFFVYDPAILARLKFEELRELTDKKPLKKLKLSNQTRDRLKDLKNKPNSNVNLSYSKLPFKKCSKPNYPELRDIKIKVGTELDGNYFNPAEVSKNAKKFDDRVKKLHIPSDADLDEIEEPLTKSESSDEVTANSNSKESPQKENAMDHRNMNGHHVNEPQAKNGTFTNTIKSKEFQEYLEKKGLTLIPKKIPNGARSLYSNTNGVHKTGATTTTNHISFRSPESVQISLDTVDSPRNAKKPSVFQRLLSNSIFASRRKTTPKETVPTPKSLYESYIKPKENGSAKGPSPMKRVVLERQSFHGRPDTNALLSSKETNYLRNQLDRSRKSFASGDDLSISSALTNAEYNDDDQVDNQSITPTPIQMTLTNRVEAPLKPIAKPPRRTLSKDRLGGSSQQQRRQTPQQQQQQLQKQDTILKPIVQRANIPNNSVYSFPRDKDIYISSRELSPDETLLRRSGERQSLIPKRSTQTLDRRQVFGRSSSMDRNEILKRNANRSLQNKSKSANESLKVPTVENSKENLQESFTTPNGGPVLTSTPVREPRPNYVASTGCTFVPIAKSSSTLLVDQQEWERLRAVKEHTDRELYYKMLQKQHNPETIYERLQPNQAVMPQVIPALRQPIGIGDTFTRGSPQRNTFSGVIRNRQATIIDGKAVLVPYHNAMTQAPVNGTSNVQLSEPHARSQSVLDNMTLERKGRGNGLRRGYESETETPVIMRRKNIASETVEEPRRIGGLLTREEILQKVKEFCRKSLNKTPTNQPGLQAHSGSIDLSPVSYASVETHQRPISRMYAVPQVPQRMQSLPQQLIPVTHEIAKQSVAPTASPIYAHVVKRSSIQSNHSELYDNPQRPYLVQRENEAPTIYVDRSALPPPTQYVIVEDEKVLPAQVLNYYPADIYAQPQYIRPMKLQPMPSAYGYITVREPMLQQLRPRLHDGRSTPLILDRSSQQASQIYWTPQHQRLQLQQYARLPIEISPRYTPKQPHFVSLPTTRSELNNRATKLQTHIPNQQQQQQHHQQLQQSQLQQHLRTEVRANTPNRHLQNGHDQGQHPYEWESGSEAGEVQRIMEQRNSGELKSKNFFKNLQHKISKFLGYSKS